MTSNLAHQTPRSLAADRSRSWQGRRTALLQEVCIFIAERIAEGTKSGRAIKEASRKFRNRSLGNGRVLNLSRKTAERAYYNFLKRGKPAFGLHYAAPRARKIDPLFLYLVIQAAIRQSRSISDLLTEAGISRRDHASLGTIYRALPAKEINRFLSAEQGLIRQKKRAEEKVVEIERHLRTLRAQAEKKFLTKGPA